MLHYIDVVKQLYVSLYQTQCNIKTNKFILQINLKKIKQKSLKFIIFVLPSLFTSSDVGQKNRVQAGFLSPNICNHDP
jgi:hypothetical protein